jgi:hypothetical protein
LDLVVLQLDLELEVHELFFVLAFGGFLQIVELGAKFLDMR